MLSYLTSWFKHLLSKDSDEDSEDDQKENYLVEQLIDLEYISCQEEKSVEENATPQVSKDIICFQRTGVITFKDNDYVLIDGMFYFDLSTSTCNCNVNDLVLYLGYKNTNDTVVVVRILENRGMFWGEEDSREEKNFQIIDHVLIGEVSHREDRHIYIKESDIKFNLDDVEGTFIPIKGDWLELNCEVQMYENKPSDISMNQVLTVTSFKPLRSKITSAFINSWTGTFGVCDKLIYFDNTCLLNRFVPQLGSKVMVEAIESNQNQCTWRAIKIIEIDSCPNEIVQFSSKTREETFELEKEKKILATYPLEFENLPISQKSTISLNITNNSNETYVLNKWIMLSKKRDSQIIVEPKLSHPIMLFPGKIINFAITCSPKFLGKTRECLVLQFKSFQIKRFIDINVAMDQSFPHAALSNNVYYHKSEKEKIQCLKKIRDNNHSFIPGEKSVKMAAFVAVRLGSFPVPEKLWNTLLSNNKHDKIFEDIENRFPFLTKQCNGFNYTDKWHTLLYMEEIQQNIHMRAHDNPKVFLIRYQEYLCVQIKGLAERRPSIIKGDRAIVKDLWSDNIPCYEGYVHTIKGDLVVMKFNMQFHNIYNGSDVSIEFHFSRTMFRRMHHAINCAIKNLGTNVLFPSRILTQKPQFSNVKLETINWFNKNLNYDQKSAVVNILLGESRPMPYCIFGPPGTGKTITVIELILQLLTKLPESRILVATPSNSAANLVTERMIQYKNDINCSIVRLIANHLVDSENIPDMIKPFCASLDISLQECSKDKQNIRNGINVNCQKTFIGRHRVTIGTCSCLSSLALIGLPKGHFTHIIIDEAGQTTEPEIMIPMTMIDKNNGQIILAGDPMQLGPVVLSRYCKEYGMDESYMSRILECYPYQRDYSAFADGYNKRLVTKLKHNYRSLEEVISLPSEMFYDNSLIAKIDRNQHWITKAMVATCQIFNLFNENVGGIFVHGIRGNNVRAEDSPSWYNPQEASMVALTVCKLFKKDMTVDDIGIITPYIAQVKFLRLLFESMGLPQPKIGSVEEFQGQERTIILISPVRSSESLLLEDNKNLLGFVKSPKRMNVAITRAQVSVILFCNPHVLCLDSLWNRVITNAVKENKYIGCDLPVLNKP
ncbi:probable RNA helicase armi [Battus philenor]|uniref:probable RNA helicase armi n=1 Tax=Battus philenor TaxID=42288 RepID=UPI0035D0C42F